MKHRLREAEQRVKVGRRDILAAGGTTLVMLLTRSFDFTVLAQTVPEVMTTNGAAKPTVFPKEGSKDPVDFSIAENAFWNEQLMEHAKFFIMLMPVPELNAQR